jgi:hypothetical protein
MTYHDGHRPSRTAGSEAAGSVSVTGAEPGLRCTGAWLEVRGWQQLEALGSLHAALVAIEV